LGSWVARWADRLQPELKSLLGEAPETPVSTADAFWMARDLAALIDQMQTEGISFADLERATDVDISQWWRLTHTFLAIVREHWPHVLEDIGKVDPSTRRNLLLNAERERIAREPADKPFIVAGSTGTIPATARLIQTVAMHPAGAVILPGYTHDMDAETATCLNEPGDLASAIGHPQYGMHTLVRTIGVQAAGLVEPLAHQTSQPADKRRHWVNLALAPSPVTSKWVDAAGAFDGDTFTGVAIVQAPTSDTEALAIACALRETLLDPAKTCALVTPDRALARRVSIELRRFGITADDSGGTPFSTTPHGQLLTLALGLAVDGADPNALVALLKHPLVRLGLDDASRERLFHALELYVLRGPKRRFALSDLIDICAQAIAQQKDASVSARRPSSFPGLDEETEAELTGLCQEIVSIFSRFTSLLETDAKLPVHEIGALTIALIEALVSDGEGICRDIYETETGEMLRTILDAVSDPALSIDVDVRQWPAIVNAFTAGAVVKPDFGGHPRVAVWGTLEARLQSVDLMVLGGLNEGTWPPTPANDPFITRGMKNAMSMEPPERRIGLAAHDFQMGLGTPEVILTRTLKQDGAPTVASRWLQRLETLAGNPARDAMRNRGDAYVHIGQTLTQRPKLKPCGAPEPRPPVAARPKRLSVTEIETLRRDPYAIYAKHVLRLRPLDPVLQEPDASVLGTLFHDCAEAFVRENVDFMANDAVSRMLEIARSIFDRAALPRDIDALWWARMKATIPELMVWEREREPDLQNRLSELTATAVELGATGVFLGGRTDRFDARTDGLVDIVDWKTGGYPSVLQVQERIAPQLPLEAALLQRGAFNQLNSTDPGELIYVKMGSRGEVKTTNVGPTTVKEKPGKKDPKLTSKELAERDWNALVKLIAYYGNANAAYPSNTLPAKSQRWTSDYDHLARVAEWAGERDGDTDETGSDW
ncbi:MAG: double-strand break repair protein AddB, partial [Pseudomonadota bacterium]